MNQGAAMSGEDGDAGRRQEAQDRPVLARCEQPDDDNSPGRTMPISPLGEDAEGHRRPGQDNGPRCGSPWRISERGVAGEDDRQRDERGNQHVQVGELRAAEEERHRSASTSVVQRAPLLAEPAARPPVQRSGAGGGEQRREASPPQSFTPNSCIDAAVSQ